MKHVLHLGRSVSLLQSAIFVIFNMVKCLRNELFCSKKHPTMRNILFVVKFFEIQSNLDVSVICKDEIFYFFLYILILSLLVFCTQSYTKFYVIKVFLKLLLYYYIITNTYDKSTFIFQSLRRVNHQNHSYRI